MARKLCLLEVNFIIADIKNCFGYFLKFVLSKISLKKRSKMQALYMIIESADRAHVFRDSSSDIRFRINFKTHLNSRGLTNAPNFTLLRGRQIIWCYFIQYVCLFSIVSFDVENHFSWVSPSKFVWCVFG